MSPYALTFDRSICCSGPRLEGGSSTKYSSWRNVSPVNVSPLLRDEDIGSIHLNKDGLLKSAIVSAVREFS